MTTVINPSIILCIEYQILLLILFLFTLPSRTRLKFTPVGAFLPTGQVIHDDATDWDGTFVHMTDANDYLELISGITEQATTADSGSSFGTMTAQEVYLEEGERITRVDIQMRSYTTAVMRVSLRVTRTGADVDGYTEQSIGSSMAYYGHDLDYIVPTTGKYFVVGLKMSGDTTVGCRSLADIYRGITYCYWQDATRRSGWDANFHVWAVWSSGSYEHDTTAVDVGAGVDWGIFSWTEVLDGATIVAKVKTSPDDADWGESWQTLSNGDYITGTNRYLRYRFEITDATENTRITEVVIEYAV